LITILHASFVDDRLVIWGEHATGERQPPLTTRRRRPAAAAARLHPFAASDVVLKAALPWLLPTQARAKGRRTVWLPTLGPAPMPSSPLLGETPTGVAAGDPTLSPWLVPCRGLDRFAAVATLRRCHGQTLLAPGVVIGPDLAFWARALRLALAMVVAQRFLPSLTLIDGVGIARWESLPREEDWLSLATLAAAMPPAARAVAVADDTVAPARPVRQCLDAFLAAMVDALVRRTVVFGPEFCERAAANPQASWLVALDWADGLVDLDQDAAARLAEQVASWRRPLTAVEGAPYRLCIRLEEPSVDDDAVPDPDAPWRLEYLVQAADDPSLSVPAEHVWKPRSLGARTLKRGGADPRAFLLVAVAQAAALSSRVEGSLAGGATPIGCDLGTPEAHAFLTDDAPALEQAGFKVLLPSWWIRRGSRRKLKIRARVRNPKLKVSAGLTLETIMEVAWEIALGDQTLSPRDLDRLARQKAHLVRVRGEWVEVNAEDIREAVTWWRKRSGERLNIRELALLSLGATPLPGNLEFAGVQAEGWVGEVLDRLAGNRKLEELPAPPGLCGTLRPYQVRGLSWLAFLRELGLGACLADDMGLGKTVQALALIQRERERGETRPVLLLCPMSVVANWRKEAERFTPDLPVLVHHGIGRHKGDNFVAQAGAHALVVSSYALLHRDLEHLRRVTWAAVVLDEAQNIKNAVTKQARAARALDADYRLALTGTPVENSVGDLWSIMEFLNPGLLGSHNAFRKHFLVPIQAGHDDDAAERLRNLTGPFVLRRLKTDRTIIDDLPEKQEAKVFCNLTREQATLYGAVLADLEEKLESAEGIERRGLILAVILRLKQACNHPAHLLGDGSAIPGRSGKVARLTEMLEEVLAVGERALVFTQFVEMGHILQTHLQETFGREAAFLHGGLTKMARDAMVDRFQSADGPPIFILSLKAGGTGLNLTAANHVFHFDRWWNPAVENQATDRAFRIGQTRNVQAHKFVCAGTFEERIDALIDAKQAVADRVVGSGEGWITELSNDDLRRLFALRAEAVGE
jgi:superfamily II DNA or RNA helicase